VAVSRLPGWHATVRQDHQHHVKGSSLFAVDTFTPGCERSPPFAVDVAHPFRLVLVVLPDRGMGGHLGETTIQVLYLDSRGNTESRLGQSSLKNIVYSQRTLCVDIVLIEIGDGTKKRKVVIRHRRTQRLANPNCESTVCYMSIFALLAALQA
jgi:hypothetical protein